MLCISIVAKYRDHSFYLIKMKVLTYTSYKEHCELYTEIHGSIAVNSCHVELAQKDIVLLSCVSVIFYKTGARTGVENNRFIKFSLSAGTYSIDDFNAKIKVAVLQERQDWAPPQIKYLRLIIPEHYTLMTSNIFFVAHGILNKHLEKTTRIKSILPLAHTKHPLIHHLLQNHWHCTVNKSTKFPITFYPMHLVFLELDTHRHLLYFKIIDENNNEVIPRTFYIQLLNKKMSIYDNETKIYPDLNPTAPQEP